jgi:hypothetical protein
MLSKYAYLVPALRVRIVNVVEGVLVNLSQPGMFPNTDKTIWVPLAIPPARSEGETSIA